MEKDTPLATLDRDQLLGIAKAIDEPFFELDENDCFSYMNNEAEMFLGRDSASLKGKNVWQEYPGLKDSNVFEKYYSVKSSRTPQQYKTYYEPWQIWFQIRAYPTKNGVLIFFRDINQEKMLEHALKNVSETKDKIFRLIAHDLRSPVANIMGISALIEMEPEELNTTELREMLIRIHSVTKSTYRILEDLLTWSNMSIEGREPQKEPVDLRELIQFKLGIYETDLLEKDLRTVLDIENDLSMITDRMLLESILRNLITNAIKFSEPGGLITISAKKEQNQLLLSISDNGIGLPNSPADVSNMSSTMGSRGEQGAGVGLKIVGDFIKILKGSIIAKNNSSGGATFTVRIPYD